MWFPSCHREGQIERKGSEQRQSKIEGKTTASKAVWNVPCDFASVREMVTCGIYHMLLQSKRTCHRKSDHEQSCTATVACVSPSDNLTLDGASSMMHGTKHALGTPDGRTGSF